MHTGFPGFRVAVHLSAPNMASRSKETSSHCVHIFISNKVLWTEECMVLSEADGM